MIDRAQDKRYDLVRQLFDDPGVFVALCEMVGAGLDAALLGPRAVQASTVFCLLGDIQRLTAEYDTEEAREAALAAEREGWQ